MGRGGTREIATLWGLRGCKAALGQGGEHEERNRPRVRQDAKLKPPSMPNDRFEDQKSQDPLAIMPRICNPRAMSDGRRPAAEGVADKINITYEETRAH